MCTSKIILLITIIIIWSDVDDDACWGILLMLIAILHGVDMESFFDD